MCVGEFPEYQRALLPPLPLQLSTAHLSHKGMGQTLLHQSTDPSTVPSPWPSSRSGLKMHQATGTDNYMGEVQLWNMNSSMEHRPGLLPNPTLTSCLSLPHLLPVPPRLTTKCPCMLLETLRPCDPVTISGVLVCLAHRGDTPGQDMGHETHKCWQKQWTTHNKWCHRGLSIEPMSRTFYSFPSQPFYHYCF